MGESEVLPGMGVAGSDGEDIGKVKEILPDGCFRVDVPMAPDYYVPIGAVLQVKEGTVSLRVKKSEASYMGWELKPHQE